jgi:hypothetical protein
MFRRDRSHRVGLAVATAVAEKLRAHPDQVIARASSQLPQIRGHVRGLAVDWVDEWARLLDGPLDDLERALTRDDQHGANMRSVAPLAGILTWEERTAALRTVLPNLADDDATLELRGKIAAL